MQREVDVKNTQLQQKDTQLQQKEGQLQQKVGQLQQKEGQLQQKVGQLQQQATALRSRATETNWQQRELQALKVLKELNILMSGHISDCSVLGLLGGDGKAASS